MTSSVYSHVGDSSRFTDMSRYYGNLSSFKLSGLLVSVVVETVVETSAETTSIMSGFLLDKNALTNPNNKE